MPDLSDLSRHRSFGPPPGGLDAARADGRRYRAQRQLLQVGSGTTAAVLLVALALYGGSGAEPDALVPAEEQAPSRLASAAPALSPAPVPAVGPAAGAGAGDRPAPGGSVSGGAAGAYALPRDRPAATAAPRPQQPAPAGPYAAVQRAYVRDGAPQDCDSVPVTVVNRRLTPLCSFASVSGTGRNRTLGVDFCVPRQSDEPTRLSFAHGREVGWTLAAEGDEPVWTWGGDAEPEGPDHEVAVAPGDCLTWRTAWRAVDDNARPVPRGSYTLTASLLLEYSERSYTAQTQV